MKKLRILIASGIIAAMIVPFSVFAAASDSAVAKSVRGFLGIDFSKLTDQQKTDVDTYSQKMADLQKEFVNKMVENGSMTREQGDAEIKRIDEALKESQDNGTAYGFGAVRGFSKGDARSKISEKILPDTSKLTEGQIADLKAVQKKMVDLQKEYIDKAVTFGLLTKEQSDKLKKNLDDVSDRDTASGAYLMMGRGLSGFVFFGINGDEFPKLTDQQKSELESYSKEMAGLQKEMINKLAEFGVMSNEQADAATKRIDAMSDPELRNDFSKGMGMLRKGRPNKSLLPGKSDEASDLSSAL